MAMSYGMAETGVPGKLPVPKDQFVEHSSRNLLGDQKAKWIEQMRTKLPMSVQDTGPFGMRQDLRVQVAQKKKVTSKPGVFLEAIKAIKINAVIASEKKFIIGAREFHLGDAFPIIRGQRQFNIKVSSVKSDHIVFMNVDTGQYVRRNLNALPPGMTRNTGMDAVPGVTAGSKKDSSPLHLDSPTLPASTTRNN